jgi:hypothetical protein
MSSTLIRTALLSGATAAYQSLKLVITVRACSQLQLLALAYLVKHPADGGKNRVRAPAPTNTVGCMVTHSFPFLFER